MLRRGADVPRLPFFIGLAMILALGLPACTGPPTPSPQGDRLRVVASILPLADFASHVGGERVQVEALVPPGASPHTFELTPAQLRSVSGADVLVLNGLGLEYWAEDMISAAANPDLIVVHTSEGLDIIDGDGAEGVGNPHVWLSPRNANRQVQAIRDTLGTADPDGAATYRQNGDRFIAELEQLDRDIRQAVAGLSRRDFIAFHNAWVYFARDYGLQQAAVVEMRPGQEPSPSEIADIVAKAREIGARAIFAEPQFSAKAAEVIAEESGAQVLFLNPLGRPPDYSYLETMRANLGEIAKALP